MSARGRLQTAAHKPVASSWALESDQLGKPCEEPGKPPASSNGTKSSGWAKLREAVSVPNMRDPDIVALKPRMVRRIVSGLSGNSETWVPPAGLYLENSKHGLNQNLWDVAKDTRHLGPKPEQKRAAWMELPQVRDPETVALKPKHVRQVTKNLSGDAATFKPPAGLYLENSRDGLGYNMWEIVRQQQQQAGVLLSKRGGAASQRGTARAPAAGTAAVADADLVA